MFLKNPHIIFSQEKFFDEFELFQILQDSVFE